MMPRKKKTTILIISIILLIAIMVFTLIFLYINTDMFKSNETLFTKYLGQNIKNMEEGYSKLKKGSEYDELLKQSQYTTETQVRVNYTKNIGTSLESTENAINNLSLKIKGQKHNANQYSYQDICLLNNDEKVAQIEYLQQENTYGIKFSNLFSQYILIENENLKELFEKAGYTGDLSNIPDKIEFNNDLENTLQFSEDEIQDIEKRYINIISSNVSKNNFSKQKNQAIQINGKEIKANAYILTLTKEQFNNIYIKILEEMKQDEIILDKMDKIQQIFEKYQQISEQTNLRNKFTNEIEKIIEQVTRNNIGQDEVKITVYENNKKTISTIIENPDYEIYLDYLSDETQKYNQIYYKNKKTDKEEKIFTYKKDKEETNISLKNVKDEKTSEYSFVISEKIEENNNQKNIFFKFEDETNRVETTIQQEISLVNNFEDEVSITDENSINLSELEEEKLRVILNKVTNGVIEKVNEIKENVIKLEDLVDVLNALKIAEPEDRIEETGITETEKNRFNSQFEILQGEQLENVAVLKIIEALKENLIGMEVISNKELKLKLDRNTKDEEVVNKIQSFIEKRKDRKFDVKVEYDETTGLVSDMLLTMLEK